MLNRVFLPCWCGSGESTDFAPGYRQCCACQSLLSEWRGEGRYDKIKNEEEDFYGKNYWYGHQTEKLGLPDLPSRAKTDFVDRYPHWLRLVYDLGLTAGKALELGCGHGGFVYLLRQMGFDATGLELSPWLADFARHRYQVPMMVGQLTDQKINPRTYDLVLGFDVLEHLEDPLEILQSGRAILKPGGQVLLQTPVLPEGLGYPELLEQDHPFLKMLLPDEHLYLFTASSLRQLLKLAGFAEVAERDSVFPQHDITVSASTDRPAGASAGDVDPPPIASALMTLFATNRDLTTRLIARERDANERLELLNRQEAAMVRLDHIAQERLELLNRVEASRASFEHEANERLELLNRVEASRASFEHEANERLRLLQDADVALQEQMARRTALEAELGEQKARYSDLERSVALTLDQTHELVRDTCNACLDQLQGLLSRRSLVGAFAWQMGRRRKYREILAKTTEVNELVHSLPAIRQRLENAVLTARRSPPGDPELLKGSSDTSTSWSDHALTLGVLIKHLSSVEKAAAHLIFLRELLARELKIGIAQEHVD